MILKFERDELGRRELIIQRGKTVKRDSEISLQPQISAFWDSLEGTVFGPSMIQFIWVAERCVQLNAQQIAAMPLVFQGNGPASTEPAWLSNPDPVWYPNGIADAVFSAVDSSYRFGDAFLYVTDEYATGFPSAWTVLSADAVQVTLSETTGRREYKVRNEPLDPTRVVQISRNPRGGLRGTSALRSYAQMVQATSTAITSASDSFANLPPAVLKSQVKLTQEQAEAIQDQWVARISQRRQGIPPVLDPKIDFVETNLAFSPHDLLLVEVQEFNARVLASAFGVPPFALNLPLTGGLTYQNPAMMRDHWWFSELHPSAKRLAAALTAQMLPRGNAVVFDPTEWIHQGVPGQDQQLDSQTIQASPADQTPPASIQQLRPVQEVGI